MAAPRHPTLYQINTRVWLHELGLTLRRGATFDDISDASIDEIAADGFDWVWLLGVRQSGEAGGRQVSLRQPDWQPEYRELRPDFHRGRRLRLAVRHPRVRGAPGLRRPRGLWPAPTGFNHLRRRAPEPVDRERESFYNRLLACMPRPEVRMAIGGCSRPSRPGGPVWEEAAL